MIRPFDASSNIRGRAAGSRPRLWHPWQRHASCRQAARRAGTHVRGSVQRITLWVCARREAARRPLVVHGLPAQRLAVQHHAHALVPLGLQLLVGFQGQRHLIAQHGAPAGAQQAGWELMVQGRSRQPIAEQLPAAGPPTC